MEYTPFATVSSTSSTVQNNTKMEYVPYATLEQTAYAAAPTATQEQIKDRYMTFLGAIESVEWAANFLGELTPKQVLSVAKDLVTRLENEYGYPASIAYGGTLSGWEALAMLQEGSMEVSWVALRSGLGIKSDAVGVFSVGNTRFNSHKLALGLAGARIK